MGFVALSNHAYVLCLIFASQSSVYKVNYIACMAARVPKPREHNFPKKTTSFFLNFIGPVTPPWVLYPSEIMHLGSTELLLTRSFFAKSIKVLG